MNYIAYTDGSYKNAGDLGQFYSGAAIVAQEGTSDWVTMTKVGSDSLVSMRNVAGEIAAVILVCEHCLNTLKLTQDDTLYIYYDYEGIANWCKPYGEPGFWKAKNETTASYREYILHKVKPRFKVVFNHIKSHSGDVGNSYVDSLAKKAIAQRISELSS